MRWYWILVAIALVYIADATYANWDSQECKGRDVSDFNISPSSPLEMKSLLGRNLFKPQVDGCHFTSSNTLRNLIERFRD